MTVHVPKQILKNLRLLIQKASTQYANEFVWQDIELTDEFKNAFSAHLASSRYDIEFFTSTAVITTALNKYIFVPNQWFVIASYAVEVYMELMKYKEFFRQIANDLGSKPDIYAKTLRDTPSSTDQRVFIESAQYVLRREYTDENAINDAVTKLWRFATDYSWWSGQKTIDRGDFYISVILNMLNLVNVSQGYVADIVSAYGSDSYLRHLVRSADAFTTGMIFEPDSSGKMLDEAEFSSTSVQAADLSEPAVPHNTGRIKISASNLKEIKYRG